MKRIGKAHRLLSSLLAFLLFFQCLPLATARAAIASPKPIYAGKPLPVDLKTGELVLASEDVRVGIDTLLLAVTRVYRSNMQQTRPGLFGWHWHSMLDMQISRPPGGNLKLLDEAGRLREYILQPDGSFSSKKYEYETIRKNAGGGYTRYLKNGIQYRFDASCRLAEITDANGRYLRITRHLAEKNKIVRVEDRYQRFIALLCNPDGQAISVSDNTGLDGSPWRECRYSYDEQQNLVAFQTRAGGQVFMAYNQDHQLTALSTSDSSRYVIQYTGNRVALQKIIFGAESETVAAYDYTPEQDGSLALKVSNAAGAVMQYHFQPDGQITAIDPTGVAESVWLNERELPIKAAGADGKTMSATYDDHFNVTTITVNGATTKFAYGADDTLSAVEADGGQRAMFTYDAQRNVTTIENQQGATTTLKWDEKGQLVSVKSATGASAALFYDKNGQIRELTTGDGQTLKFDFTMLGVLRQVTTPTGVEIVYRYDPLDRLIGVENSMKQKAALVRNEQGQVMKLVDPAGNETTMEYDPAGLLAAIRDPLGAVTKVTHDAQGNVIALADANHNVTQWAFDPAGRVLSEVDALGKPKTLKYNAKGQLQAQTNRRGQTTTFSYDKAGRLIATDLNGDPATFAYDPAGRLVEMKDGDSDYRFAFCADGLLRTVTDSMAGKSVTYEYDAAGRRIKMSTGDDEVLYTYDTHGRLSAIKSSLGKIAFDYDKFGRRSSLLHPNGVQTTYGYDKLNRLTDIRATTKDGSEITHYRYTFDLCGNRTSMIEGANRVTTYDYDAKSQLVKVTQGTNSTEYTYDSVGNRISVVANGIKEEYTTGKDNQMLKAGSVTFGYDADGNMVNRTLADGRRYEYRYDTACRMVEAGGPDGRVNYGYAPNGARVRRTVGGKESTRFIFDQEDVIAEIAGGGKIVKYLHGPGIDEPLALSRDSQTAYCQTDGLGSITRLTGMDGAFIARYEYDAFGKSLKTDGRISNNYTYTAREWDTSAAFYFYRARFYDASTGRFTTKDPLGFTDGLNAYTYVYNNPTVYTDPSGEFGFLGAAIGGLIGGGVDLLGQVVDDAWNGRPIDVDLSSVADNAVKGAIVGFCPIAAPLTLAAYEGGKNTGQQLLVEKKNIGQIDWGRVGTSTALGFVEGVVSAVSGKALDKLGGSAAKALHLRAPWSQVGQKVGGGISDTTSLWGKLLDKGIYNALNTYGAQYWGPNYTRAIIEEIIKKPMTKAIWGSIKPWINQPTGESGPVRDELSSQNPPSTSPPGIGIKLDSGTSGDNLSNSLAPTMRDQNGPLPGQAPLRQSGSVKWPTRLKWPNVVDWGTPVQW